MPHLTAAFRRLALSVLLTVSFFPEAAPGQSLFWREVLYDDAGGVDGLQAASDVVVSPDGRQVYVASPSDGALTTLGRDPATGEVSFQRTLRQGRSPDSVLFATAPLVISPDGGHLYGGGSAAFSRSAAGVLALGQNEVESFSNPNVRDVVISPDGQHLYATNGDDLAILRRGNDGSLTLQRQFREADLEGDQGLLGVFSLVISPDGRDLYAVSPIGTLSAFRRDTATGDLSFSALIGQSSFGNLPLPFLAAFSPDGSFLYVTGLGAGAGEPALAVLRRNPATGGLSFVETVEEGPGLVNVEILTASPDGRFLFTGNFSSGSIGVLRRDDTTGLLSLGEVFTDPQGRLAGLVGLAVSADGTQIFAAASERNALVVLDLDGAGSLSLRHELVDGAGASVDGLDDPRAAAVSPDSRHVYVASAGDNAVSVFAQQATSLSQIQVLRSDQEDVPLLGNPRSVLLSPDGRYVYSSGFRRLGIFERDAATGLLASAGAAVFGEGGLPAVSEQSILALSPDGRHLYAAHRHVLTLLERDAATGQLSFSGFRLEIEDQGIDKEVLDLTFSPDGRHLYASSGDEPNLFVFERDVDSGQLVEVARYSGTVEEQFFTFQDLAVSPDGRHLYVLLLGPGDVREVYAAVFDREAATGELELSGTGRIEGVEFNVGLERSLALSHDGSRLYVTDAIESFLAVFDRNATTGQLTLAQVLRQGDGGIQGLFFARALAVPPDDQHVYVLGRIADTLAVFRQATTVCAPGPQSLCLNGGRFVAEVSWRTPQGDTGRGQVVPVTSDDSGLFWFFEADNWEMLLKVLDGCGINNHYWVFSAATTNVEYTLTVTDSQTGAQSTYTNPQGRRAPALTDTRAFATCPQPAGPQKANSAPGLASAPRERPRPAATTPGPCVDGNENLCLAQERFRVEVEWETPQGDTGAGRVVPFGSDDSGLFWFFAPDNWEMLVKVLDGCAINGRRWVFAAATTNVAYTLRVTDTQTGAVREYVNPQGTRADAITDTRAFESCP